MLTTFKEWVSITQSLITCIAIIYGGLWGWHEYDEKKNQDRINESFKIVSQFKASEEYRSYEVFADSDQVNNILHDGSLKDKGNEKLQQIAKLHNEEIKQQLKLLIEMYVDAVICVEVNHCDKNVIAAFMGPTARTIYVIGRCVIEDLRNQRYNDPKYANELVQVSDWYYKPQKFTNPKSNDTPKCN